MRHKRFAVGDNYHNKGAVIPTEAVAFNQEVVGRFLKRGVCKCTGLAAADVQCF